MIDFCTSSNRASQRLDMILTPTELLYHLDWKVLRTVVAKLWRHRGAMWGWRDVALARFGAGGMLCSERPLLLMHGVRQSRLDLTRAVCETASGLLPTREILQGNRSDPVSCPR
jgi:hypothetical protein